MDSSTRQDGMGGSRLFLTNCIGCNPKEIHREMDRHVSYRLYRVHRWCSDRALGKGSFVYQHRHCVDSDRSRNIDWIHHHDQQFPTAVPRKKSELTVNNSAHARIIT